MDFTGKLDPNMWVAHYDYTGIGSYRRVDASAIRVIQLKDIDFRTSNTISNIVLPGESGGYGGTTIVYEEGNYYVKETILAPYKRKLKRRQLNKRDKQKAQLSFQH